MFVADVAFTDDDVRLAVAEFQPEHGVAGQGGQGAETATECGAEVIVIRLQRSGHDELCAVVAFQCYAHGVSERNLLVEETFGVTQKVVVHGMELSGCHHNLQYSSR